jgi:aspartyl/asparaginyl beta-hydroxylase (cupin superfamily)
MIPEARVVAGKVCRTNMAHRPFPTLMNFPGLNSKPFHNLNDFDFVPMLMDSFKDIRQEYLQMRDAEIQSNYQLKEDEHTLNQGEWIWYNFIAKGVENPKFKEHCPKTTMILNAIPGLMRGTPFSYSFFSIMKPGTIIDRHYGPSNIRLRCHLPLVVPEDGSCILRVADQTALWQEGRPIIFDDTYDHEACNLSEEGERAVLLFDFWHPELKEKEKEGIINMFKKMEKMIHERKE